MEENFSYNIRQILLDVIQWYKITFYSDIWYSLVSYNVNLDPIHNPLCDEIFCVWKCVLFILSSLLLKSQAVDHASDFLLIPLLQQYHFGQQARFLRSICIWIAIINICASECVCMCFCWTRVSEDFIKKQLHITHCGCCRLI